jgi:acyl-coenzyme A thioesterase PaaI-like protein
MNFLGCDERETIGEPIARLSAEHRIRACAGAVGFELPVFQHEFEKLVVLKHSKRSLGLIQSGGGAKFKFFLSTASARLSTIARMLKLPHTKSCFVCGLHNPGGLKLDFETDGRIVRARFAPRPEHVGFKQTVHGGIISMVLDEAMVWAIGVRTKRFAYCAELTVRFLLPARPGEELVVVAELTADRRGKLFEAKAELRNQQEAALASATGKYLPVKADALAGLLDDFAESTEEMFG